MKSKARLYLAIAWLAFGYLAIYFCPLSWTIPVTIVVGTIWMVFIHWAFAKLVDK